jgi:hypothetical protein
MNPGKLRRVGIVLAILACWWCMSRQTPFPSPSWVFAAAPIPINQTFTIPRGQEYQWTFSCPQSKTPGRLYGHWSSRGASDSLKYAMDDTLVGFTITDPNNKVLQQLSHQVSGNFDVRYEGGVYTFTFSDGVLRPSARIVTLEGTYQPD